MIPTRENSSLAVCKELPPPLSSFVSTLNFGLKHRNTQVIFFRCRLVLEAVEHVLEQLAVPADRLCQQTDDQQLSTEEQQRRRRDQRLDVAVAIALDKK